MKAKFHFVPVPREKSFFPSIEVSGMSISQSIEAPLTLRDTLTLNGNLSTQNGNGKLKYSTKSILLRNVTLIFISILGSGSFVVSCKRLLMTNGWIEGEFVAGNGPIASVKLFRTITKTIFGNFATQFKLTPSGIKLGFASSR